MTPSLISGWPNFALSAAMMMSHCIASSQPPPSAKPATAAITGLRMRAMRVPVRREILLVHVHVALARHLLDVGAGGERLLRAGDDHAADVRRPPRTRRSRRSSPRSACALSALSACGRLRRMMPTLPLVSTMMVSWLMTVSGSILSCPSELPAARQRQIRPRKSRLPISTPHWRRMS